ncbi:MAG TPA: TIGR00300 family protein, partial [Archaeoglobus veneficus]|nr:TIGR00300 family protein [Archaeoglobus veneficus]
MLHSIAVGNLLPSTVKTICVDINPATVTKLIDRGTAQAIGIVTDVGLFVPLLYEKLKEME